MTALATQGIRPQDPSNVGYPPLLPVELALRVGSVQEICAAYGIERAEWDALRQDPVFVEHLRRAVEEVKKDGVSYKLKARLQAEAQLKTCWNLVHDVGTPPAVKADLIKFTARVAGYDVKEQVGGGSAANNLQININLG